MVRAVLSLGGSVINPNSFDLDFLRRFAEEFSDEDLAVVCGGGRPAREVIQAVRSLGGSEFWADVLAVEATKLNARLVALALGWEFAPSLEKALEKKTQVVMGGTIPGITTDTDAVLLAEGLSCSHLINVSRVGGIRPSPDSPHSLPRLTWRELEEMALEQDFRRAGTHFPFDLVAIRLARRSGLRGDFVGPNPLEIRRALEGREHSGTVVLPEEGG